MKSENFNRIEISANDLVASDMMPKQQWHKLVEQQFNIAIENNQPLSVIFIDVDNLKSANDTFGHAEGDHTIDNLAGAIKLVQDSFRTVNKIDNYRPLDYITVSSSKQAEIFIEEIQGQQIKIEPGRIGGDEFAVLCHTDKIGAEVIIDRLTNTFRNAIGQELKDIGEDISIGANTVEDGMSLSEFLKTADDRLYQDKISHLPQLNDQETLVLAGIFKVLSDNKIQLRNIVKYAEQFARNTKDLQGN